MDTGKIISKILSLGICQKGRQYLEESSKDIEALINGCRLYPEFIIDHSEEIVPMLREYAGVEEKKIFFSRGILLDYKGSFIPDYGGDLFILGSSCVTLNIQPWNVVKAYVFNDSKVDFKAGFHAYVNIESYNNSRIKVEGNTSFGYVYVYDKSQCETICKNVKVKRKNNR